MFTPFFYITFLCNNIKIRFFWIEMKYLMSTIMQMYILIIYSIMVFFQCFLCQTENDFNALCHKLKEHLVQSDQLPSQSLITICDDRPSDWMLDSSGNLSSSENVVVSLSGTSFSSSVS